MLRTLLVGLAFLLVGCPEGPEVEESSSDAAIGEEDIQQSVLDFHELVETIYSATCEKAFECCSSSERNQLGELPKSKSGCGELEEGIQRQIAFTTYREALRDEVVRLDRDLAQLCVESIRDAPCSDFSGRLAVFENEDFRGCPETLRPTLEIDEECSYDVACESDYCEPGLSNNSGSTCQRPPKSGESCPGSTCATGSYCDQSAREPVCASAKSDGDSCQGDRECSSGYCTNGTCDSRDQLCNGN